MRKHILFFLLILSASFLTACGGAGETAKNEITVYYLTDYKNYEDYSQGKAMMSPETVELKQGDDPLHEALAALVAEPEDESLHAPIPSGAVIQSYDIDGNSISVDISSRYTDRTGMDLVASNYCIVLTLCGMEDIESVSIYVDGIPQSLGMTADDVLLSDSEADPYEKDICLYYVGESGDFLIPEYHALTVDDSTILARYVIEELLRGPISERSYSAIPEGTELNSIEVRDGVCYVDFSSEFIRCAPEDIGAARLCVYSIVNSLTEIADIEAAGITVEGGEMEWYSGIPLSGPLERNERVIGPVNSAAGQDAITVYLKSECYGGLVPVKTIIQRDNYLSLEETAAEALVEAESEPGLVNVIPRDTQVLSAETRNGICYLDISDEFLNSRGDEDMEDIAASVKAFTYLLTSLENVEGVKISINGIDDVEYGDIDFSQVFKAG